MQSAVVGISMASSISALFGGALQLYRIRGWSGRVSLTPIISDSSVSVIDNSSAGMALDIKVRTPPFWPLSRSFLKLWYPLMVNLKFLFRWVSCRQTTSNFSFCRMFFRASFFLCAPSALHCSSLSGSAVIAWPVAICLCSPLLASREETEESPVRSGGPLRAGHGTSKNWRDSQCLFLTRPQNLVDQFTVDYGWSKWAFIFACQALVYN